MTDQFNPQADQPIEPTPAFAGEPVTPDAEAEEAEEEDFFSEDDGFDIPDAASFITINTISGGKFYVPVPEGQNGMTIREAMNAANITVAMNVEYWLNGSKVTPDTFIPAGQSFNVMGTAKGG